MLDAHVIVEVLEVAQTRDRAERMGRDRGRAVCREIRLVRVRDGGYLEQPGDAAAARHIGLEAVHDVHHPMEVREDVPVLAGCDLDSRWSLVPDPPQSLEVV